MHVASFILLCFFLAVTLIVGDATTVQTRVKRIDPYDPYFAKIALLDPKSKLNLLFIHKNHCRRMHLKYMAYSRLVFYPLFILTIASTFYTMVLYADGSQSQYALWEMITTFFYLAVYLSRIPFIIWMEKLMAKANKEMGEIDLDKVEYHRRKLQSVYPGFYEYEDFCLREWNEGVLKRQKEEKIKRDAEDKYKTVCSFLSPFLDAPGFEIKSNEDILELKARVEQKLDELYGEERFDAIDE